LNKIKKKAFFLNKYMQFKGSSSFCCCCPICDIIYTLYLQAYICGSSSYNIFMTIQSILEEEEKSLNIPDFFRKRQNVETSEKKKQEKKKL
jgi:hypothetical protein